MRIVRSNVFNFIMVLVAATVGSISGASAGEPVVLPTTVVTAQKAQDDPFDLPVSLTAAQLIPADNHLTTVKRISSFAPSVLVNEFTARALSNPYFRGIGGSPINPGVTTYIDGVPQLNSYSSSIELVDVERVEFVRGPQGALFGRNTSGGLVNITSSKPSRTWTGYAQSGFGNYSLADFRAGVSGPVAGEKFSMSMAGGYSDRQGYTKNLWNGDDIDSREGYFGKAQFLFSATEESEVRLLLSGERDRDGDYAFGDLAAVRRQPHEVTRDFTDGYNDRDVLAPTLIATRRGESLEVASTTGYVYWKNDALTDLDYGYTTPQVFWPYATRENEEQQNQVTQEFRVSSSEDSPIALGDNVSLALQGGLFLFYRDYNQEAVNTFAPPLAMFSGASDASLTDYGLGVYGQGRVKFWDRLELSAGARFDAEEKEADLSSSSDAAGVTSGSFNDSFSEVTPQVGLSYGLTENHRLYATVAAGYKAGGFNPPPSGFAAPDGTQSYDPEHSWNYEMGYKTRLLDGKFHGSIALYYIQWEDLQLNQQYPGAVPRYYIGNAGSAVSKGVELEASARPLGWLDVFASFATMDAEFLSGSSAYNANLGADQNVGGNELPFAPDFTASGGAELRWTASPAITLYWRGQVTAYGEFQYDAANGASQPAYAIADFRAGARSKHWFAEMWVANAFDEDYVPIAIPYAQLGAPSGYIGESGAPLTFGGRFGVSF